jgi:nanoRNase/pAp phosphatase (c-di-AMP/oligoRNAs hydrolase)
LKKYVKRSKCRKALIFCHHNADPDAVFSAHILCKLLRKIQPRLLCDIVAVEGASSLSRLLMATVPVKLKESPRLEDYNLLFMVDTSTTEQLGNWKSEIEKSDKPLILIDHHAVHPKTRKWAKLLIVDQKARSTCEILYKMCKEAGLKLNRKDLLGLLFGIIHETRGLRYASAETFQILADISKSGLKVEKAFQSMMEPMDKSEKIARIKAASRLQLYELGGWIIGVSKVGSYQASAARALISLGCDLAIVGGEAEGEVRVSLRSTPAFHEKTGIHLGENVAMKLGEKFSGMGGGHASSAGVNCKGSLEEVLFESLSIIKELLNIFE